MSTVIKHTPAPWIIRQRCLAHEGPTVNHDYIRLESPWKEDAWQDDEVAAANAAHIVKCVNAHDDLVAALKTCEEALRYYTVADGLHGAAAKRAVGLDAAHTALKKAGAL